jgi:prephenate dehydrogenase
VKIGIVGCGLIGGSIGLACRSSGHRVVGSDAQPAAESVAFERGCIDERGTLESVAQSELVFVCVPPVDLVSTCVQVCRVKPSATVVSDCASVKGPVVEWLDSAGEDRFVPGHPMAGHEKSGAKFASAWMFRGAKWILTPGDYTASSAIKLVESVVVEMGAIPVRGVASQHDREVAVLSHLPHALAAVLVKMGARLDSTEASAGSWRDLTRVGGVAPNLWTQILLANRHEVVRVLSEFQHELGQLLSALEQADEPAVREFFAQAQQAKEGKE